MAKLTEKNVIDSLLNEVLENYDESEHSLLNEAFLYASEGHKHQKRKSGESYITHPLQVAHYLSKLNLDTETIIAAFLHDLIEDTDVTHSDIKNIFCRSDMFDG